MIILPRRGDIADVYHFSLNKDSLLKFLNHIINIKLYEEIASVLFCALEVSFFLKFLYTLTIQPTFNECLPPDRNFSVKG